MKIAVVASAEMSSLAHSLIKTLMDAGNTVYGLKFNDAWQNETRLRIDTLFKGATHVICLASALTTTSTWLPFVIGYARGDNRHLSMYRSDPSWTPPPWLLDLPLLDHLEEAVAYFETEKHEWETRESRRHARAAILEMGISWHADSLAQCVREGDSKTVGLFIASGFLPDSRDKHGVPLLCLATRAHHLSLIELLLEKRADINLQGEDRGYSPLMDAAQLGDETILRFFIARGADLNLVSKDGQSALILAVGRNDSTITKLLLENGSDVQIIDKLGLSALKYAKLFHNQAILDLFEPPAIP